MQNSVTQTASRDRLLLRNAIGVAQQAQQALTTAENRLHKAESLLKGKEACLAKFAGTDELLAEHRLAVEKAHAASGGVEPRMVVPPDVIERVKERDDMRAEVESIREAVTGLQNDHAIALAVLHKSERRCNLAAAAVLQAHSKELAGDLREAQQRVWDLSASIRGLSRCWTANPIDPDGALGPISLSHEVLPALDRNPPQVAGSWIHNDPVSLAAARYRVYHANLQRACDAEFEEVSENESNKIVA